MESGGRIRNRFVVDVDQEMIPGWGYDPKDVEKHIQQQLDSTIGHYHPTVQLITVSNCAHGGVFRGEICPKCSKVV